MLLLAPLLPDANFELVDADLCQDLSTPASPRFSIHAEFGPGSPDEAPGTAPTALRPATLAGAGRCDAGRMQGEKGDCVPSTSTKLGNKKKVFTLQEWIPESGPILDFPFPRRHGVGR